MFSIGHAIAYKKWEKHPLKAAIVVGYTKNNAPIVHRIGTEGELKRDDTVFQSDCFPIRVKNTESPSGFSVYKGKFYVRGRFDESMKLKLDPSYDDDFKLLGELSKIQQIMDSNQTT